MLSCWRLSLTVFILLALLLSCNRQDNGLSFLPWSPLGGAANAGGKGLLTDAAKFPNLNRIAAAKQCRLGLILHAPLDKLLFLLTELTCKYCIFSFDLLHACV
jgi:hypothetical protein